METKGTKYKIKRWNLEINFIQYGNIPFKHFIRIKIPSDI